MPRLPDDDAPRWELPVWEPPSGSPLDEVQRRRPRRGPAARTRAGVRTDAAPTPRAAAPPKVSLVARPFAWWAAHPWIVSWIIVVLAPAAVVLLRALDESGFEGLVQPLAWAFGGLLLVALVLAMMSSARRSVARLALGTAAALLVLVALLWPVTQVTLGRTACPAHAGGDLGAPVAAGALDAWKRGAPGDAGWRTGRADGAWHTRSRAARALDYQLVETGCWERAAPIDAGRTWHEFRVTVRNGADAQLSKSVVVHTAVGGDGWKITAIEGPLP